MQQQRGLAKREQVSELDMARTASGGQLGAGQSLMRVGGQYQTAISVQVKRDIGTPQNPGGLVLERATTEAMLLAERYFYGWEVNDRQGGGKKGIEGVSVDGAHMLLRCWGNSVVDVDLVEVTGDAYTFKAVFVDLETGSTVSRLYRQARTSPPGRYDEQRWQDMQFSNGQSRAIRNVITSALPQWLQDRCMDAAHRALERQPTSHSGERPALVSAEQSASIAAAFANKLRSSWGRDELSEIATAIKSQEGSMRREDVAGLRDLYRKQLAAWEQGGDKVPDGEYEEGEGT